MRIYIGEDSVVERKLIEAVMNSCPDVEWKSFDNGLDLWHACLEDKPDMVIVDLLLPTLTGFEFCELLRRHKEFQQTPWVLAVSSVTEKGIDAEVVGHGANDFLPKPFEPAGLRNKLDKARKDLLSLKLGQTNPALN